MSGAAASERGQTPVAQPDLATHADVVISFEHRKADVLAKLFETTSVNNPGAIRFEVRQTVTLCMSSGLAG